jgi:hypothetical protein
MRFVRKAEPGVQDAADSPAEPAFIGLPDEEEETRIARPAQPGSGQRWVIPGGTPPDAMPEESDPLANFEDNPDPLAEFSSETEEARPKGAPRAPWSLDRWLAVAATLIAIVEAILLVRAANGPASSSDVGRLVVAASPAGAEVLVDGAISGPAPLELPLRPGPHKVQVRYAGLTSDFTADVRAGGRSHHHVAFAQPGAASQVAATAGASGSIEITSDPAGARVSIDGKSVGVTPLRVGDLAPGDHDVVLAGATGNVTRRVRLTAGTPASLLVAMPKASAPTSGWVRVQSPILAQIYESNELLGSTEVGRLMLPAGRHTLRLVNTALQFEQVQTVEVLAGQTRVLNVAPPNGLISINAIPWAQVWIDGTARGDTPIGNLSLPIGTHEIVFRHPQYGEQRRSVTVTLGGVTRVGVDLRR